MNTAVLVHGKEVEVHGGTPEKPKSTSLGWFLLLILGTATVCHVALSGFIALIYRILAH